MIHLRETITNKEIIIKSKEIYSKEQLEEKERQMELHVKKFITYKVAEREKDCQRKNKGTARREQEFKIIDREEGKVRGTCCQSGSRKDKRNGKNHRLFATYCAKRVPGETGE